MIKKYFERFLIASSYMVVSIVAIFAINIWTSRTDAEIIHHSSNKFGPVWVHQVGDQRFLSFAPNSQVVQSIINLARPNLVKFDYLQFQLSSLFLKESPKDILLIGLGGGTIARAINNILPDSSLNIVEINPVIPLLAKKFFAFEPNKNTEIFVTDGYLFAQDAPSHKYDLILLDVFDKDYIPKEFLTPQFVQNIKRILKPQGVVAVNTFTDSKTYEAETKLYSDAFGDVINLSNKDEGGGNRVMLAMNGKLPSLSAIKMRAAKWAFSFYQLGIDSDSLIKRFPQ